jgi:Kef-type K+ transport system membrane component KefB
MAPSARSPRLLLGVILYMFVVGLHLDLRVLRSTGQAAMAISQTSILCPFVLGV